MADEWGLFAQQQARSLWHHTGQLPEDVRRAAFPVDSDPVDPTGPWATNELPIDGTEVDFRVLAIGDFWVGQAQHGDVLVGVVSQSWPISTTGLITVNDLEPYEAGSRELQHRWPRPSA